MIKMINNTIWCLQEKYSISGCRTDYIYGNTGSPHGHLVLFNQIEKYHRTLSDLNPTFL